MRLFVWSILITLCLSVNAQEAKDSTEEENIPENPLHPIKAFKDLKRDTTLNLREKLHESKNIFVRFIKAFDIYDTTYIEPNRYNWTVMLQQTNTFERFRLRGEETRHILAFNSQPGFKFGPYLGWRWIFLGYAIDVSTIGGKKSTKTEFELSLYSSLLGCDLLYRKTGDDFKIKKAVGYDQDLTEYYGTSFDGISISTIGLNLYYVMNHNQFSLPAAFSQSTVQRKSAGTWKFGLSVTKHNISIDYESLNNQIPGGMSSDMEIAQMHYMDYSLSAGYAYNWVFKKNWLFSADLAPEIGYKRTNRDLWKMEEDNGSKKLYKTFYEKGNVNFNVTGRLALVWNNGKHYYGLSAVLHNFNYRYKELSMHNTFFTIYLYAGLNFMRKRR